MGASNEGTWLRLTEALGRPDLREDIRFKTNQARMGHLQELVDTLAPSFAKLTTDEWLERLQQAGVPVGPVASVGEMLEHPHSLARDMVIKVDHARLGSVRSLGMPVKLSSLEKSELKTGAPVLGQHTGEVLSEFGYSQEEISEFVKDNVVFSSP